ncbi:unnamed protein product [Trifolium pratense]|uniref:Uncharacterized protein n=1 Tax=Trifolium pratense TaxID=57577 RepID=A0ACB0JGD5_TRIPR|nr:unnamed protein product [Trifolium pratense]
MSSSSSQALKIGIVGFGTFGQFLANTMIKQGHTLFATSRTDYSHLCLQMGIHFFRDITAFLDADMDVILLCTSISSLSEVVGSMPLNCLERPTLFVDVLSVKEHPKNLLLRVLPEESDILCTHPMFGPVSGKNGWQNLTFMFDKVRIKDEVTCSKFLHIFESEGCKMVEMSCEEHDKAAAKSQFITHTIGRKNQSWDVVLICIVDYTYTTDSPDKSWKTLSMPYKKSKRRWSKQWRKDRTQKKLKVDA